ncbi:MBL fold metallo-hydrolase [Ferviditalea candida]|uniref:MBL fold metallo-hydrolase n=1 Tax=Ferviditalea candida TaxID=3108399 RepID=A0ABU5ZK45_9BACL|nr:MBL fold metallo-hydrolase [Paenibacillaceae bacterium T2]
MIYWQNESVALFRSFLYMTVSAVIQTEDLVVVVDPTWLLHEVEEIRNHTDKILNGRPLYLLFTHSDYDHILGYKAFPGASVIASEAFQTKREQEKQAIVEQIKAFDDDYYIVRDYGIEYPEVDVLAKTDGDTYTVGGTRFVFYQAPGHNDDGMFIVIEPLGLLIAGDYFSDVEFPFIYYSSEQYEQSLLKLDGIIARHSLQMLIPGHGEFTRETAEMKRRQLESLRYIHEMRKYLAVGDQKRVDELISDCRFPRNQRKFHRNNQLLMEKELQTHSDIGASEIE